MTDGEIEPLVLTIDDSSAQKSVANLNAGLDSNRERAVKPGQALQDGWARHSKAIERMANQNRSAFERTLSDIERMAGQTGRTLETVLHGAARVAGAFLEFT